MRHRTRKPDLPAHRVEGRAHAWQPQRRWGRTWAVELVCWSALVVGIGVYRGLTYDPCGGGDAAVEPAKAVAEVCRATWVLVAAFWVAIWAIGVVVIAGLRRLRRREG